MNGMNATATKPIEPQVGPQAELYACPANEILFGGARGGGKSYALLIDWMRHVKEYEGRAKGMILRRTMPELEDLIEKAREMLPLSGFEWRSQAKTWIHANGAMLKMRYLERDADATRYQGHEYNWLGVDEAGNWRSSSGLNMLRATLRDAKGVRCRMVLTCNPGGAGHDWIKAKYIDDCPARHIREDANGWSWCYIPAKFEDNKILQEADPGYIERATQHLPEYLRRAWRDGDWDILSESGMFFRRDEFKIVKSAPKLKQVARCWDRAASEPSETYADPDWTRGVKIGRTPDGEYYVLDVRSMRKRSAKVKQRIKDTAGEDGTECAIVLFQDPGQAGKGEADDMARELSGYPVYISRETGAKHTRWMPLSAAVQNGIVYLVEGEWNEAFISELSKLTDDESDYAHDDQADAAAGAYNHLAATKVSMLDVV